MHVGPGIPRLAGTAREVPLVVCVCGWSGVLDLEDHRAVVLPELLVGKRMRSRTGLVDLSASVATLLLLLVVSHRLVLSLLVVLEGIVHFDGMAAFVHLPSPEQAQGGAEGRRWPGLVSGLEEDSLHSQGALEIRRHLDVRV